MGSSGAALLGERKTQGSTSLLVARDNIVDPCFEKSVVLMVPLEGQPIVVGLVVNKPTRLPLVKIFPKSSLLKNSSENAYLGGPVDMAAPSWFFTRQNLPRMRCCFTMTFI